MGVGSRKPKWITIVIRFKLRKNDNDEYTHDKTKEVEMMVHDDKFTKVGSQERRISASKFMELVRTHLVQEEGFDVNTEIKVLGVVPRSDSSKVSKVLRCGKKSDENLIVKRRNGSFKSIVVVVNGPPTKKRKKSHEEET